MAIRYMRVLVIMIGVVCMIKTSGGDEPGTLAKKCGEAFNKVSNCLSYVTEKANAPSKECCESVTEIRDSDPVCLCFIILQTHNGSRQIKSMGIKEERLLMLPSACKLVNASVSDCPKLLNIPKGTPEYALFTNASTSTATTTPASSTTTSKDGSKSYKHGPDYLLLVPMFIAVLFLFSAFPAGFLSAFGT